ncbi:MAG: SMI1/KNR4 family protein [Armatimonadota bacterium]
MKEFQAIVQRLEQHFDTVVVHPPAGDAALRELQQRVPAVPEVLLAFWQYCDGIQVTDDEEGRLLGVQQALERYPCSDSTGIERFIPIRGDGCGDYDCLVIGPGPFEGAVVFWDHEVDEGASYLLGGTFLSYLDMWSDYLMHTYLTNGERECDDPFSDDALESEHPWPFDEQWMRKRDPVAKKLLGKASRGWLLEQDDD